MKNSKIYLLIPAMLVLLPAVLAAQERPTPGPKNSAESSANSGTAAGTKGIIAACMAAAEDLAAERRFSDALDSENRLLKQMLATERHSAELAAELSQTQRSEAAALRTALAAQNDALAAKDAQLAAQEKLIDELKRKKPSPWRRLRDILIGAAAAAVLK